MGRASRARWGLLALFRREGGLRPSTWRVEGTTQPCYGALDAFLMAFFPQFPGRKRGDG